MKTCYGCNYYDDSTDTCNADDVCYMDGFEKRKQMSIAEIFEEIKEDVCDNYCKYIAEFNKGEKTDAEYDAFMEKYCEHCPLNRL